MSTGLCAVEVEQLSSRQYQNLNGVIGFSFVHVYTSMTGFKLRSDRIIMLLMTDVHVLNICMLLTSCNTSSMGAGKSIGAVMSNAQDGFYTGCMHAQTSRFRYDFRCILG